MWGGGLRLARASRSGIGRVRTPDTERGDFGRILPFSDPAGHVGVLREAALKRVVGAVGWFCGEPQAVQTADNIKPEDL